jgi:hypothetical protein
MKMVHIREMVREELKTQVMTESSSDNHLEERASTGVVNRVLASIGGWYLGTTIGTVPFAIAVGLGAVGVLSGPMYFAVAVSGGAYFARKGYELAVRGGPDVTQETYQELRNITVERDKVLQQINKVTELVKREKYTPKLTSLTAEMIQLGKELEVVITRESKAGKIDREKYQAMFSVAKVAQQGELTYIDNSKVAPSSWKGNTGIGSKLATTFLGK